MILIGCKENEKVNVEFIFEKTSYVVQINKGDIIKKDIIPINIKDQAIELYYDEKYENKYDGSSINKDTKIYLKKIEEQDLSTKACEAYWKQFIKPLIEDSSIEDVKMYRYLGTYGDSYVAIILDRKNCIFPERIIECIIGGLDFSYSDGYEILVYNNGEITTLSDAYNKKIISQETLQRIHKEYHNKTDEQDLYTKACETYWKQFIKPLREDSSIEDVKMYRYLGTYGDSYVAIILDRKNSIFPKNIIDCIIGELDFSYSEGYEILVYNNGEITTLSDAYNKKIISQETLQKICKEYHNKKDEQDLYTKACETYWKQFIKPLREDSSIEDVKMCRYLGTYGDSYVAIILDRKNCIFLEWIIECIIGGLDFSYSDGYGILVYNNGEITTLSDAYNKKIISQETLQRIHKVYRNKS